MSADQTYISSFPFSRIRDEQKQAIEFALDAFDRGKRFVILELGTGCGKSATAVTIARHIAKKQLSDAYVLTTQKVLQEQYLEDFGPTSRNLLTSIKSSGNYTCGFYPDQTCGESRRILNQVKSTAGTDFANHCKFKCPYIADKQSFLNSSLGVTNFAYFLAETMYAKTLEPRDILIIDECHNTESELSKFVEVTFSEKFAKDVLKCRPPSSGDQESIFKWVKGTYKRALSKYFKELEGAVKGKMSDCSAGFGEMGKQYEMLDKHICKVNRFINSYDPSNWVLNVVLPPPGQKRAAKKYEFKTIDVSRYSEEMLFAFGKRVLMLSATIIDRDTYCRSIGIPFDEVEFLSVPSPFPAENRPIHFMPVGSMSKNNIDQTLPKMAEAITAILDLHAGDKGIIHCVNYKVAQHISNAITSERLLTHASDNRDAVYKQHVAAEGPTVLVSPSMTEGVDLADDASRFQIICKIPFPYLGDEVVKKRMSKDATWYTYQTVKTIVQSVGRSIRNERDHAITYILDLDWERFYRQNKRFFPEEFVKAIVST